MNLTRPIRISSLVFATALLLGACGDDDAATGDESAEVEDTDVETTPSSSEAGDDVVTIEQSRFAPDPIEVGTGTEVSFENLDPFAHTVTSAEGSDLEFDSGELGQDETFTQVFDEAGTYGYFCEIHPTMRAEVVVS